MLLIFANTATPSASNANRGSIRVQTASGMVIKPVKIWDGANWVQKPVRVWDGLSWNFTFNTGGTGALYEDTSDPGFYLGRALVEDSNDPGSYLIYDNAVSEDTTSDPGFYLIGGS